MHSRVPSPRLRQPLQARPLLLACCACQPTCLSACGTCVGAQAQRQCRIACRIDAEKLVRPGTNGNTSLLSAFQGLTMCTLSIPGGGGRCSSKSCSCGWQAGPPQLQGAASVGQTAIGKACMIGGCQGRPTGRSGCAVGRQLFCRQPCRRWHMAGSCGNTAALFLLLLSILYTKPFVRLSCMCISVPCYVGRQLGEYTIL